MVAIVAVATPADRVRAVTRPESAGRAPAARRGALVALMAAGFADTLGAFLVLALLPFWASDLGASPTTVGVLVAAFSVAQTLSAPFWGRLSDRRGRRPVLLLGLGIAALSFGMLAWAPSVGWILVARLGQGLGAGTVSVVFATVSDFVAPERRAEALGWVTSATSAAAMVGPVVGSVASRWGEQWPGLAAAALTVLAMVVVAVALRDRPVATAISTADGRREAAPSKSAPTPSEIDEVMDTADALGDSPLRDAGLRAAFRSMLRPPLHPAAAAVWTYTTAMFATSLVLALASLLLERRFGATADSVWWFFTLLAGFSLVFRVAALGPLVRRLGEERLVRAGALAMGVAVLGLAWAPTELLVGVAVVLLACGQSMLYPCTTALVSRATGGDDQGRILGVQQGLGGSSRVVGPVLGGWLFGLAAWLPLGGAGLLLLGLALVVTPAPRPPEATSR